MVQLQEIVDEHFQEGQVGPEEDDADYTDTGTLRRLFPCPCFLYSLYNPTPSSASVD